MFRNPADLPPAKNEKERKVIVETASRHNSELNNPCIKEQNLSFRCLSENNYDKKVCEVVFANYNSCKDFWGKVQADRRLQGIRPLLPRPEEREAIKVEYLKKWESKSNLKK